MKLFFTVFPDWPMTQKFGQRPIRVRYAGESYRERGGKASSTLGFERVTNPGFQYRDISRFEEFLLKDLPPKPPHFELMREVNRGSQDPELLREIAEISWEGSS
jgi:hypothetical protein